MGMNSRTKVPEKTVEPEQKAQRWQQRKAAMTRDSILQASVKILVKNGYTGLTTVKITDAAEVSRGALHHHFASRSELLSGLIDHILHQRLQTFLSEYVSKIEKSDPSAFIDVAATAHWESLLTDEYTAYLELAMAARTDKELADLLIPATLNFDREWMIEMHKALPQWDGKSEAIELANDFATALHVGLLINRPFMGQQQRRQAVRHQLVEALTAIYRGAE
jgi:AcrR family transcriptional regulator